jgi:hypothetical protein
MSDSLIKKMEYYIDAEQDFSKKSAMRLMFNECLTQKEIIEDKNIQIMEMEEAFNKGKVNPILMREHQKLQTEYNKLKDKISKIYHIIED